MKNPSLSLYLDSIYQHQFHNFKNYQEKNQRLNLKNTLYRKILTKHCVLSTGQTLEASFTTLISVSPILIHCFNEISVTDLFNGTMHKNKIDDQENKHGK